MTIELTEGEVNGAAPPSAGRPPTVPDASTAARPPSSTHVAVMAAHEFWTSFVRPVIWDKPKTIRGTLVAFDAVEDGPALEVRLPGRAATVKVPRTHPRIVLQNDHGRFGTIQVTPAQLFRELSAAEPALGDTVTIIYAGEDGRTPRPGRRPVKQFEVTVTRPTAPSG